MKTGNSPQGCEPKNEDMVTVQLGERTYDILVNYRGLDSVGQILKGRRIGTDYAMVFTSPRIGGLYYERLEQSLKAAGFKKVSRYDIPDGEENKNLHQFANACEAIVQNFPQSESAPIVINLGGGVVGDLGGFVAATYLRLGVPYVQVTTTLLGCVDCGVGGKVGVNSSTVKNIIGRFYQPKLVVADLELLNTLEAREIRSGVAEIIKYGVVCDGPLFAYLEKNIEKLLALDRGVLLHVVGECYRIKARVVEEDEEEGKGKRHVLNYGHTIGHALEMAVEFSLTHGEAISIGMVAANKIALALGVFDEAPALRVESLLQRAGLPTNAKGHDVSFAQLLESLKHDKKFKQGSNLFVLPTEIGAWQPARDVSLEVIEKAVKACL